MTPALVLASQSPRRKELLGTLGIPFTVVPPELEEVPNPGESPEAFVVRVARDKGMDVASRVTQSLVLSADTIVTIDGEILGKPAEQADARRMLRKLSGRCHSVFTAVCVINQMNAEILEGLERTDVWFSTLSDSQIADYVQREDVTDKAGAYAIQGFAAAYIPRIEGNYSNVMGLPLPLVFQFLSRMNVDFRRRGAIPT